MFQLGDKIAHPMHGAGTIDAIVTQRIDGVMRKYYVLKLSVGSIQVMIPTETSTEIGVRPVLDQTAIKQIVKALPDMEVADDPQWNHRYRENMIRLKSGDLFQVAQVLKSLMVRDRERGLSTGERKMLHLAKQILFSEIVLVEDVSYGTVEKRINAALKE